MTFSCFWPIPLQTPRPVDVSRAPGQTELADNQSSAACTCSRTAGSTSSVNHGLRLIQPVLRQLGWGNGNFLGKWARKARTVSVIEAPDGAR
jgi:hypothetical protein